MAKNTALKKTALVTGGAGFIGSHLVEALLTQDTAVRVLDNFSTGRRENIARLTGNLELVEADIRDRKSLVNALAGVDTVFHLAAMVSVTESMLKPDECYAQNFDGTRILLEEARKAGIRRVVISSSCAVYGDADDLPLKEETPLRSLSPYAASKEMKEILGGLFSRQYGLPVVSLRYFNVYGPRQRHDSDYAAVIPIFLHRLSVREAPLIYGDGKQTRDFIYVGDVVRANLLAAVVDGAAGRSFNVCSGRETSLLELLEIMRILFPDGPAANFTEAKPGDIYRSVGDPEKAALILGFRAQTPLLAGLKNIVEYIPA